MAGIAGLHESRVVHADLKPPNVYLIRDPSIAAGYQLKLIDMDFSVLADRHYVMEEGHIVDMIPNDQLEANMEKLHGYLGV